MLTPFLGAVELRDVHFCYPARPEKVVLNGLALRAEPGEFIALVSGSGSGKSTVFHLLQHFYEPQMGVVALDGVDVSLVSHAWLHRVMACVGQEPVLFSGTVLENITYSLGGWRILSGTRTGGGALEGGSPEPAVSPRRSGYWRPAAGVDYRGFSLGGALARSTRVTPAVSCRSMTWTSRRCGSEGVRPGAPTTVGPRMTRNLSTPTSRTA